MTKTLKINKLFVGQEVVFDGDSRIGTVLGHAGRFGTTNLPVYRVLFAGREVTPLRSQLGVRVNGRWSFGPHNTTDIDPAK